MARRRRHDLAVAPLQALPRIVVCLVVLILLIGGVIAGTAHAGDPLPSWNEGQAKSAIIEFVTRVTTPGTDYVMPADRIAVFDNDGTLWPEQPIYMQLAFTLDRLRALAPTHPEWQQKEPFKSALAGDLKTVAAGGEKTILQLVTVTHAGMSTDAFRQIVRDWIAKARHPRFDRPYPRLIYEPMLELLIYLRANAFSTYISSGGGADFMRAWTEESYGIPPEQVIGSTIKLAYEIRDGVPVLMRQRAVDFINNREGKPIGIYRVIGRRPIAAFGNSDGDFQMLEWVTARSGPSLGMIVHHTDAVREYAYDRKSTMGRLDKALDGASAHHWVVIDMKKDWARIFLER